MCGRYYVDKKTWDELEKEFPEIYGIRNEAGGMALPAPDFSLPVGDMVPSMPAISLTTCETGKRENSGKKADSAPVPAVLSWGFPGFDGKKLIINARAEGISEKRMFADSIRERRCVMPAAGFYEWDKNRQKVTFKHKNDPVIYLAGIWKPYVDGNRFVIITREANESMMPIHDRMPLMIPPGNVKDWLYDPSAAKELLAARLPQLESHREYEQMSLF